MKTVAFLCSGKSKLPDCVYRFGGCGFREQLEADEACVAAGFQTGKHAVEVYLTGARLMAAGGVGNVDMAEPVRVGTDIVTEASLNFMRKNAPESQRSQRGF